MPDLTRVTESSPPWWRMLVDTAAAATADLARPIVVVGHSGAGAFLPAIGERLRGRLGSIVFVDAVLPPHVGAHETPAGMRYLLDEQTVGGRLRRWLDWWPEDAVTQLLPNPSDRELLMRDMPRLPRSFYDETVPVPDGWSCGRCAYLRLSQAYKDEYDEAGARGWPREEIDANHLSIHTEPERILDAVFSLAHARVS